MWGKAHPKELPGLTQRMQESSHRQNEQDVGCGYNRAWFSGGL